MADKSADHAHQNLIRKNQAFFVDFIFGVFSTSLVKSLFSLTEHNKFEHLKLIAEQPGNLNIKNLVEYRQLLRAGENSFRRFLITPKQGFIYALRSFTHNHINMNKTEEYGPVRQTLTNFYCGGVAGFWSSMYFYIFDFRRVMVNNGYAHLINYGSPKSEGRRAFYQYTIAQHGANIRPFYKGILPYAFGETIKRGISFGLFDTLKAFGPQFPYSILYQLTVGFVSSFASIVASFPIDVVRRRQILTKGLVYEDAFECFKGILRSQGANGLFNGLNHLIMYRSLAGALTLTLFQQLQQAYYSQIYRDRIEGKIPKHEFRQLI